LAKILIIEKDSAIQPTFDENWLTTGAQVIPTSNQPLRAILEHEGYELTSSLLSRITPDLAIWDDEIECNLGIITSLRIPTIILSSPEREHGQEKILRINGIVIQKPYNPFTLARVYIPAMLNDYSSAALR